jgi:hypothetical protein
MASSTVAGQLAEAEAALHQLRIGQHIVSISKGGRTVQFQQTNKQELIDYIDELKGLLGLKTRRRGAARVSF